MDEKGGQYTFLSNYPCYVLCTSSIPTPSVLMAFLSPIVDKLDDEQLFPSFENYNFRKK